MKKKSMLFAICCMLLSLCLYSQEIKFEKSGLEAVNVSMSIERLGEQEAVKVIMDTVVKKADQPTYVRLKGIEFHTQYNIFPIPIMVFKGCGMKRPGNMNLIQIWDWVNGLLCESQ